MGSVGNAIYRLTQKPFLWITVAWPTLFASVNGYKIVGILHERNAEVHMDEIQEQIYVEHFMVHGITPKQFERIENKAEVAHLDKNEVIIRKGGELNNIYLVVKGSTQAHILGRHLTAQSTSAKTKGDQKLGGDSGAWVGEIAFLDRLWEKEQRKANAKVAKKAVKAEAPKGNGSHKQEGEDEAARKGGNEKMSAVLYTIIAKEKCTVWKWSFEDMESLMSSSTVSLLLDEE
jgi:CRP-like cAMP-binding protein